jgi:hypothetical protein
MARRQAMGQCSFCGKSRDDVQQLIAGPNVFICDACVTLCNEILRETGTGTRSVERESCAPPARVTRRRWWERVLLRYSCAPVPGATTPLT